MPKQEKTQSSRIELRTPTLVDMHRHSNWHHNPEVNALDPPAGPVEVPLFWSIYADFIHIGSVSIYNRVGVTAELGILIGESANWSKGYGTEAVRQVLDMCRQAGFAEIHLKVLPDNARAIRCYEKCGFSKAGYISISEIVFLQMRIRI